MTWLLTKTLGLHRWVWLLLAACALAAAIAVIKKSEDADDRRNQELGASAQRGEDLKETVERVEVGNAARSEVEDEAGSGRGAALHAQCLRSARNPDDCQRFLPERPADQR